MEAPSGAPPKKRRPRKHKPKQAKPDSPTPVAEIAESKPVTEPASELQRNPSKRNRKRNRNKSKVEPKESIEAIPLEEIFPGNKVYPLEGQAVARKTGSALVVTGNGPVTVKKTSLVGFRNAEIENLALEGIFPSFGKRIFGSSKKESFPGIEDIQLEGIFPSPETYTFESNAIARKLKIVTNSSKAIQKQSCAKPIPGIIDISAEDIFPSAQKQQADPEPTMNPPKTEKSKEEVKAEREAKKKAKQEAKTKVKPEKSATEDSSTPALQKSSTDTSISEKLEKLHISDAKPEATTATPSETKQLSKAERKALFEAQNPKLATGAAKPDPKPVSKAERRALQEAQRAAKAEVQAKKAAVPAATSQKQQPAPAPSAQKPTQKKASTAATAKQTQQQQPHMVKLFNHLYTKKFAAEEIVNSPILHPAIVKLGLQYADGIVAGSKSRCLAFLEALKAVIGHYETPPEKEFGRGFEETLTPNIAYLQKCRPFSVSMTNALKYINMYVRQLNAKDSESKQKEFLFEAIDTYIRDQIEKAEEAICISVQEKIYDGDVLLTYGCSSLIRRILEEAHRRTKRFRVVIVDSRPRTGEHDMLRQLVAQGVDCTVVLINAISYVIPEVTKVLLSAHALLANGCVMSRVGTAQIALVAKSYNVPVLVCCETHKFSERVQTDAFVYNEIGNPNELILDSGTRENRLHNPLAEWESISHLTPLNMHYDVTPPELVTAVVTEVAILPCTSVPVILRIKPSEVGY
uniref:Translation initiation factor eIF2B subunit delta n=2 Tax=Culex pipiens TaxID=7175 RepID=A0A8D8DG64_CULPI